MACACSEKLLNNRLRRQIIVTGKNFI